MPTERIIGDKILIEQEKKENVCHRNERFCCVLGLIQGPTSQSRGKRIYRQRGSKEILFKVGIATPEAGWVT